MGAVPESASGAARSVAPQWLVASRRRLIVEVYGGTHQHRADQTRVELAPSSPLELSEEWIAYLNDTDVPSCVDGVDSSITYDDDNTALA